MPQAASWTGTPSIKGKTEAIRMALLTFSLIGLQFTWGIEMTWCTPYLLKLGLSKSKTSLVWIAGPLSGLIMQPIVGALADNSRSRFGRRRPYMIGGSIVVVFFLITLGWAKEIVQLFTSDEHAWWTIALAVGSIYAVDFAINAVQSSCRSLIVDTLPIPKQQTGSAWATRMIAVGHLVGYGVGTVDLPGFWGGWLGDTQLKQLIVIASVALLGAVGLTSWAVKERVLVSSRENTASGLLQHTTKIIQTTMHLPRRIQAICWIQFWAWIGWFPFLFYGATWVGETYFSYNAASNPAQSADDRLSEIGRIGSLSLLVFSFVTLAGSIILPLIVSAPDDRSKGFTPRPPPALATILNFVNSIQPDLLHTWLVAHIIFALAMGMAPLVRSVQFATVLVAICGIPWALAAWAPFSFMGVEINRLSAPSTMTASGATYRRLSSASLDDLDPLQIQESPSLRLHHLDRDLDDEAPTGELAGIYLGILNLYTTLPQFVGTFISMIVFAIFEPGKSKVFDEGSSSAGTGAGADGGAVAMMERLLRRQDVDKGQGVNAIGICLFIGAISSLGAAYATLRLKYVK